MRSASSSRRTAGTGPAPLARRGFSLLEVLLALAILLLVVVTLSHVAQTGARAARRTRLLAEARALCDARLAEWSAGLDEETASEDWAPLPQAPGWLHSIERAACDAPGLECVTVRVRQDLPDERRPVEVALVRWCPTSDSSQLGDEAEGTAEASAANPPSAWPAPAEGPFERGQP